MPRNVSLFLSFFDEILMSLKRDKGPYQYWIWYVGSWSKGRAVIYFVLHPQEYKCVVTSSSPLALLVEYVQPEADGPLPYYTPLSQLGPVACTARPVPRQSWHWQPLLLSPVSACFSFLLGSWTWTLRCSFSFWHQETARDK